MDNSLLSCFFSWVKTGSAGESGGKKPDWVIMLLREEIYWFVKSGYRTCIITKGENRLIKGLRHDWRTKAKASLSLSGVLMWSLGPLFSSQLLGLLVESLWLLLWKPVLCLKSHIYCFFLSSKAQPMLKTMFSCLWRMQVSERLTFSCPESLTSLMDIHSSDFAFVSN